jgi:ferredoxin-type protein NapG
MNDHSPTHDKAERRPVSRRKFLTDMAKTACGVGLFGVATGLYARQSAALPAEAIRPPGALPEHDFLAACTRCGLCVRDCPYDILRLAEPGDGIATGTPYFTARSGPCQMCEDIPCIPVCPTGALDHGLTDIKQARMGLAVVVDQETCIAFRGLRCEVCYNICPVRGKAIKLEYRPNTRTGKHAIFPPVVNSAHCTGCGLCEKACILEQAAIKVLPIRLAKGELGHHYRLGWENDRKKLGKQLPTADAEHKYNLPEGMHYEYGGRGLVVDQPPGVGIPGVEAPAMGTPGAGLPGGDLPGGAMPGAGLEETPFSANPLETLNRGLEGVK